MKEVSNIKTIAGMLAFASFCLIMLGGYVRGTGAGLACPDWPLCYGKIVPDELKPGLFQEVTHRFLAAGVSVGFLVLLFLSFQKRLIFPRLLRYNFFIAVILICQVILGGLTVIMKLNPFIVTAHLALGTLFFQLLFLIALPEKKSESLAFGSRLLSVLSGLLVLLVFAQILLGGFMAASGASLVCPNLFTCTGSTYELLPPQLIHMLHRVNGLLVLFFALGLAFNSASQDEPKGHIFGLLLLVLLQVILGFASVYFRVPVVMAVIHLGLAQLILASAIIFFRRKTSGFAIFDSPIGQASLNIVSVKSVSLQVK